MIGLEQQLEILDSALEEANTQDQFVQLIETATMTLQKAIDVSKFEFVDGTDEKHFESQLSPIIKQIDDMYDWAIGKMKS